ncbi:unnamed protein product [Paramecium octaurelia]|uniref:Uncharacterized protein n=1 Tax=Paramecium octaurelia TaxID=43137 RepID=A0A8S1W8Q0_PAROT|nr:unnamed protein product [Paramecium octaurelia]
MLEIAMPGLDLPWIIQIVLKNQLKQSRVATCQNSLIIGQGI